MIKDVVVLHGGELSSDVAKQLMSKLKPVLGAEYVHQVSMAKSKAFKSALIEDENIARPSTLAVFIVQTVENEAPVEDAGACIRFFKRRTHPNTMLCNSVQFTVLGLGDSNLLLDRQHTAAKDCNQVAQALDARLEALGGTRYYDRGEADERTGLTEIEPWIDGLVSKLKE